MLTGRFWIRAVATPLMLTSAGCVISPAANPSTQRGLSPDRLMQMGRMFEHQGHLSQAKMAYSQVANARPEITEARESLDAVIAAESRQQQLRQNGRTANDSRQIANRKQSGMRNADALVSRTASSSSSRLYSFLPPPPSPAPVEITPTVNQTITFVQTVVNQPEHVAIKLAFRFQQKEAPIQNDFELPPPSAVSLVSDSVLEIPPSPEPVAFSAQPNKSVELLAPPKSIEGIQTIEPSIKLPPELPTEVLCEPSIPLPLPIDPAESLQPVGEQEAATQIIQPISDSNHSASLDLEACFEPFHVSLVEKVKANRKRLQPALTEIAVDRGRGGEMQSRAAFLLGAIGPEAVEAVGVLRAEMHSHPESSFRIELAEAILKIQPGNVDAINVLLSFLKQPDTELKWLAAFAMRQAASAETTFLIDALKDTLRTSDARLKRMVILIVAEFGPAAANVIPELEQAAQSQDDEMREVALASLACIVPQRATTDQVLSTWRLTEPHKQGDREEL